MKKRNLYMSLTLICGCCCLAFTFDNEGIYWLWSDAKPVAIILAIATIVFGALWMQYGAKLKNERQK